MSEDPIWTELEQCTMALDGSGWHLMEIANCERQRAIDFAWGLCRPVNGRRAVTGKIVPAEWPYQPSISDEEEAAAFLHGLGYLEKHPANDWYRIVLREGPTPEKQS